MNGLKQIRFHGIKLCHTSDFPAPQYAKTNLVCLHKKVCKGKGTHILLSGISGSAAFLLFMAEHIVRGQYILFFFLRGKSSRFDSGLFMLMSLFIMHPLDVSQNGCQTAYITFTILLSWKLASTASWTRKCRCRSDVSKEKIRHYNIYRYVMISKSHCKYICVYFTMQCTHFEVAYSLKSHW